MAVAKAYHSGDIVPTSGLYKSQHPFAHPPQGDSPALELSLNADERFPACGTCGKGVSYQLIAAQEA